MYHVEQLLCTLHIVNTVSSVFLLISSSVFVLCFQAVGESDSSLTEAVERYDLAISAP